MTQRRITLAAAASCFLLGALPAGATDTSSATPSSVEFSDDSVTTGPMVIETIDEFIDVNDPELLNRLAAVDAGLIREPNDRQSLELGPGQAALTGGFVASFDANVPTDVRAAVGFAVDSWSAALETPIPIVIQISWTCLGDPGILGYAGASEIYRLAELPTDYGYPTALANALTGTDLNGSGVELRVVLNAELAASNSCSFAADRWHTASSEPSASRVDMTSVVLHEIAHGLGFLGSAWRQVGANSASLEPTPYMFDSLVQTAAGPLLGQSNPGAYLTTSLSIDVGGGNLFSLYTPSYFVNGSSFSHFNSATTAAGRGGTMMRPDLGSGTSERIIDAAVLGVLVQQGWTTAQAPVSPTLTATVSSQAISVTIDPNLDQAGEPPISYRVVAKRGGVIDATVEVPAGQQSVTLAPLYNNTSYQVSVTPIGRTANGTTSTAAVTMAAIPNSPRQVSAAGAGSQQTVSWVAPVAAAGGESYRVEQRLIGGAWSLLSTTTATSVTTGALPTGVYQFRVRAERDGRSGPYGASLLVGVSSGIVRPLPLDGQIGRLFSAYFLREPDASGFSYWTRERAGGTPLAAISAQFASSSEFVSRYGSLSDADFVNLVYQNVLGRPADAAGSTYWINQLRSGRTRGEVMVGFSESPEYVAATATAASTTSSEGRISRLYFSFFLREPDAAGLAYWMAQDSQGASIDSIASEMARSTEFQTTYGNITDSRFVEAVYNNVLTRSPDPEGQVHWLQQLSNGLDRGAMIAGFSESTEFILRTGTMP